MLNVHYVTAIQMIYTSEYVSSLIKKLEKMGHSDANPFVGEVILGAPIPEMHPRNALLNVQTKAPATKLHDYHIWIRPLSGHVMLITEDGPKDVDVVYGILTGSDSIPPSTSIDDTMNWVPNV